jgi:Fe-S cluster biogenesis protein NfuA
MFIQTETTPNEDSLKFIPGTPVMETGSAEFLDTRAALASPLALRLFGIEGVKAVFYGPDFVTVTKDGENYPWAVVKPEVYSVLMEHFSASSSPSSSGGGGQSPPPLFRSEEDRASAGGAREDLRILETDSDTVAMIKELLDTRVRPAIMEDGGDIEYRGFSDEGIVKIKLKGSCRGCESSTVTLKTGIERMLVHYIPEVKGTEQVRVTFLSVSGMTTRLDRFWMKKKRLRRTNLANSSSASIKSSIKQKSATQSKCIGVLAPPVIGPFSAHTTSITWQSGTVHEHIAEYAPLIYDI